MSRFNRGDCWEWRGARSSAGYGNKRINYKVYLTHRLAYEWAHGPVPDGLSVLHRCDNPPCCNPDHLYVGDHKQNALDMVCRQRHASQKRTHCPYGHPLSGDNLVPYSAKHGKRACWTCKRESRKRYNERLKARRTKDVERENSNQALASCTDAALDPVAGGQAEYPAAFTGGAPCR